MDKNKKAVHSSGQPRNKYLTDITIPLSKTMNKINRNTKWILQFLVAGLLIVIVDFIISAL